MAEKVQPKLPNANMLAWPLWALTIAMFLVYGVSLHENETWGSWIRLVMKTMLCAPVQPPETPTDSGSAANSVAQSSHPQQWAVTVRPAFSPVILCQALSRELVLQLLPGSAGSGVLGEWFWRGGLMGRDGMLSSINNCCFNVSLSLCSVGWSLIR